MAPRPQIELQMDETNSKRTKPVQKHPKSNEKRPKIDRPKIGRKNARGFGLPHGAPVETQPRRGRRRGSTEPEKRIKKILGAIAPKIFFDAPGDEPGERRTRRTTNQTNDERTNESGNVARSEIFRETP